MIVHRGPFEITVSAVSKRTIKEAAESVKQTYATGETTKARARGRRIDMQIGHIFSCLLAHLAPRQTPS